MFTREELHTLSMMAQSIWDLRPNTKWQLPRPDFESLVWEDEETEPPTWPEIEARMAENQAIWESRQWIRDRIAAYPPITDQLDTIYHGGIEAWRETIAAVKEQYPKPDDL